MSDIVSPDSRSLLVRFCDAFLQERNIKWMLAAGMVILLASSFLLVGIHLHECAPVWKYFILLAYTALFFGAGEWARHRLALPRTATVLQALTVLLLPITFLVLNHLSKPDAGSAISPALHLTLIGVNLAFSFLAARRIFHFFLRGHQPTFLVSFLMLSLAGAYVPGLHEAWAPEVALALWAVFAAGSVKVNRHVFWLIEEHRAPRIFGFFPILLLGTQFLTLYVLHAPTKMTLDWVGLGCVLLAIPVLLTADAVARVFQQRTGNLVRPLPWAIVGPLVLGLTLCFTGVCLAGTGLVPNFQPKALVLSSALAAVMMAVVARRTEKQAFVWAMLVGVMLAYNFCPAFFIDVVRQVLDHGARIVHEPRLPIPFYGLTYLPLLLTLMTISWLRVGKDLFAQPLRRFSIGLGCLMLAVSLGHIKALFPVALCMTAMFALQIVMFREGRLVWLAIVAWMVTAGGIGPFAENVVGVALPAHAGMGFLALGAGVLLLAGRYVDGRFGPWMPIVSATRDDVAAWLARTPCQSASLVVTVGLACYWLTQHVVMSLDVTAWPISMLLAVLLAIHAMRWGNALLAAAAILFAQGMVIGHAISWPLPVDSVVSLFTGLLLCQWLLAYVLERYQETRIAKTFGWANFRIAAAWLTFGMVAIYLPAFVLAMLRPLLVGQPIRFLDIGWPMQLLMLVWSFDAARREANATLTTLGCLGVLGFVGAMLVNQMGPAAWIWLPLAWALTALTALPIVEWLHGRLTNLAEKTSTGDAPGSPLVMPISFVIFGVFSLAAVGSLWAFPLAMRLAGAAGLTGLIILSYLRRQPEIRLPALVLVNLQLLSLTALTFCPRMVTLFDLSRVDISSLCLPMAFLAMASLLLWQVFDKVWRSSGSALVEAHLWGLRALALGMTLLTLPRTGLTAAEVFFAGGTFLLAGIGEVVAAMRRQGEERVWIAEALSVAGAGYFAWFHVIPFGHGTVMFVLLGVGILLWAIGEFARHQGSFAILTRPFQQTAMVMPMLTVLLGVLRHFFQEPVFLGASSLALFMAAGFYFWRGLEKASKPFLILSGLILNAALILLWRDLVLADPQFFMIPIGLSILALVQLLKQEIPEGFHDPLRYLGALVILVSPIFHMLQGGSWVPFLSLMVASVMVLLLAIGLRVRALMYTGAAFLLADLTAMLVRGGSENANVLWIAGLALGAAVITLGAICERHRENLVLRMRVISEALQQWQ